MAVYFCTECNHELDEKQCQCGALAERLDVKDEQYMGEYVMSGTGEDQAY